MNDLMVIFYFFGYFLIGVFIDTLFRKSCDDDSSYDYVDTLCVIFWPILVVCLLLGSIIFGVVKLAELLADKLRKKGWY